jgi:hypothetical protein
MPDIAIIVTCHEPYLKWLPTAMDSINRQLKVAEYVVVFDGCRSPIIAEGQWRVVEGNWQHPSAARNAVPCGRPGPCTAARCICSGINSSDGTVCYVSSYDGWGTASDCTVVCAVLTTHTVDREAASPERLPLSLKTRKGPICLMLKCRTVT